MTRIAYVVPAPLDRDEAGRVELDRRAGLLSSWAASDVDVIVRCTEAGPASIESAYEEFLCVPPTARVLVDLAADGTDAAIIGCFGDPGLDALRELVPMLSVGPASASFAAAMTLGRRVSILTITASIVPTLRRLVIDMGARDALASIRPVGMSVSEVNAAHDVAVDKLLDQGRAALAQDDADVLVLGCMSMGFLDVADRIADVLGVPVINPAWAALKHTEGLVSQGLRHSRRAYPCPPKVAAGASLDDLYVTRQPR